MTDPIADAAARKGSAELLILAILDGGELHGYEIARAIAERSAGILTFRVASLYPVLYRLEDRGWIEGRWVQVAGRRRRRYQLTSTGRRMLARQRSRWSSFIAALTRTAGLRHA